MSKYFGIETVRAIFFVFLLMITSPLRAADHCDTAVPMDLGGSLRAYADEPVVFRLEVPSAGILSVDAAVSGLAFEPGLGLASCARGASAPLIVERSASHLVVAVDRAGDYLFRVASPDPGRVVGDLKISSVFVAVDPWRIDTKDGEDEEEIEIDSDGLLNPPSNYGEDEEEIEIDSDGLTRPPTKDGEDEEEIEIDSDGLLNPPSNYGEDEEEIEIDSDGLTRPPTKDGEDEEEIEIDSDGLLSQLCRQGEVDDHGDSFTCATWLEPGIAVGGDVGNGRGDDADVFRFVLDAAANGNPWAVVIGIATAVPTAIALYDGTGQRLDRSAGERIVRMLRPGAYYVRVVGRAGAEGHYRLSVDASR